MNDYAVLSLIILVILFLVLLMFLPSYIRKLRLEKLGKFYGLSIIKTKLFYWSSPLEYKVNMVNGVLNGHNIEIYDKVTRPMGEHGGLTKRESFIVIDNNETKISGFITGFASMQKIRDILNNLK